MKNLIDQLQHWYASQCDDVWEHSFGVEIANIDNPGWKVKITGASAKKPLVIKSERTDDDWVRVTATEAQFMAYGGPCNLQEILALAVDWLN